ncbi:MAG: hypothetical protein EOO73_07635 [Myxococcales bacterium]|nr:MAG: hypothetical protein EOO73_07635 [Myxococcales bacterium]
MAQPRAQCARWLARLERYGALTRSQSLLFVEQARAAGTTALRQERLIRLARGLEVEHSVMSSGFAVQHSSVHDLPYFESPVSGTCRVDRTYAFNARKVGEAPAPLAAPSPEVPIPLTSRLQSALQQAVVTAGIAALVDGRRSLFSSGEVEGSRRGRTFVGAPASRTSCSRPLRPRVFTVAW